MEDVGDFAVVIGVVSVLRTQNKHLLDVPFSHTNRTRDPWKECCIH